MLNLAPSNSAVGKRFYHYHCVRLSLSISCRPCSHYSEEIWKGKSHSENSTNVFFVHPTLEKFERKNNHQSFYICACRNLGRGNHMFIVMLSFRFQNAFRSH